MNVTKPYTRLDFYADAITGLTVIGIGLMAFAIAFVLTFFELAHGAPVMRAQPAPNGGLASSSLMPDGKFVIEKWNDGTVTTNAVKLANTPTGDRPQIESELRKTVIVSAALAEVAKASFTASPSRRRATSSMRATSCARTASRSSTAATDSTGGLSAPVLLRFPTTTSFTPSTHTPRQGLTSAWTSRNTSKSSRNPTPRA